MGRSLGLTEAEFGKATLAKVTELYRIQILKWARTRDYFVAEVCAITLNSRRRSKEDHFWSPDDFLNIQYPKRKKSVKITLDPDRGAACPWQDMKQSLKDRSVAKRRKRHG